MTEPQRAARPIAAALDRPEPEERLIYPSAIEALVTHALRGRMTPRLRELLKTEGVNLDKPLLPAYPTAAWTRCLRHMVTEVYPGVPQQEAFRQLGMRTIEGYGETLFGRALMTTMRLLGPRRMVVRFPRDLRAADNYTNVVLTERGPTNFEMRLNWPYETPGYMEGLFTALLTTAGAREPDVKLLSSGPMQSVFGIRWTG